MNPEPSLPTSRIYRAAQWREQSQDSNPALPLLQSPAFLLARPRKCGCLRPGHSLGLRTSWESLVETPSQAGFQKA